MSHALRRSSRWLPAFVLVSALSCGTGEAPRGGTARAAPRSGAVTVAHTFDLAQLGAHIRVDYQATMAASLDLSFMKLAMSQLDITRVTVNGSPSAFYTTLLKKLMTNPTVRARVSAALTEELQRRILAETLFGLGDVLP